MADNIGFRASGRTSQELFDELRTVLSRPYTPNTAAGSDIYSDLDLAAQWLLNSRYRHRISVPTPPAEETKAPPKKVVLRLPPELLP